MPKKAKDPTADLFRYEKKARADGALRVAGVDEAGMGPLAGPVAAAAVIVRDRDFCERIDDSKKLTELQRQRAYLEILRKCEVGIGTASVDEVDRLKIHNANILAMVRAVNELSPAPDSLLVDGRPRDLGLGMRTNFLIRGDSLSFSVACASIIAKVFRDAIMRGFHEKFPEYGFDRHKGYGTRKHIQNIERFGPCPIHRRSFKPCRADN